MQRNQALGTVYGYPSQIPLFYQHYQASKKATFGSGFLYAALVALLQNNRQGFLIAVLPLIAGLNYTHQLYNAFNRNFDINAYVGLEEVLAALPPQREAQNGQNFYVFSSPHALRNSYSKTALTSAILGLAMSAIVMEYMNERTNDQSLIVGAGIAGLISLLFLVNHVYSQFNARTVTLPNDPSIQVTPFRRA